RDRGVHEAQRAWNRHQTSHFKQREKASLPPLVLEPASGLWVASALEPTAQAIQSHGKSRPDQHPTGQGHHRSDELSPEAKGLTGVKDAQPGADLPSRTLILEAGGRENFAGVGIERNLRRGEQRPSAGLLDRDADGSGSGLPRPPLAFAPSTRGLGSGLAPPRPGSAQWGCRVVDGKRDLLPTRNGLLGVLQQGAVSQLLNPRRRLHEGSIPGRSPRTTTALRRFFSCQLIDEVT